MQKISRILFLLAICLFSTGLASRINAENPSGNKCSLQWYEAANAYDSTKIDVLYLVSTEVLSATDSLGNVAWQSQLTPSDLKGINAEIAWIENNMFHDDFNISAPIYHQYTFDAIIKQSKKDFAVTYSNVAAEVIDAFDYYMEHKNNGRPFILAGFSQGAMYTLDILKHMTDSQFSRMIACYTIGYRLSADDLKHPHIKAATCETDKGVVISFNSVQNRKAIWPFVTKDAAVCINPVNWKTDSTPATFSFDGTTNTIHIDKKKNVLIVETDKPSSYHSFYDAAPFFLNAGVSRDNLHHWDLLFYAQMIHDNAMKRAK